MQCKKAENSVIQQQSSKKVLFSQIELKSVTWPKKRPAKQFLFKKSENCITTANKHKKGFGCDRAEKSVNYKRKAKMLLWFRFKLKQRDSIRTTKKPFPVRKKVRTLQFLIKAGKQFHLSEKQLELA